MSQTVYSAPVAIPPEVLAFADEQGVRAYLPAVVAMTQQHFPRARRLSVFVEADMEIADVRYIVLEVEVTDMSPSEYVDAKFAWGHELFQLCPAPLVCVFVLALEIVAS